MKTAMISRKSRISRKSSLSLLGPIVCAILLWAIPQSASAYNWKFCLRWNVNSTDSGISEDFYTSAIGAPARGALVYWSEPWSTSGPGRSGYARLDGSGCFALNSNFNSSFTFKLYADLKMGATSNIRVKGYASQQDKNSDTVTKWTIFANPGGSGGTRYFYVPADPMGRLMGYGQWIVKRLDEEHWPRISGNKTMNLVRANCPTPGSMGSCGNDPTVYIYPGHENYKFLIGHEIGHWFHDVWGSLYGQGYEGTRGNDWDCWFPNEQSLGNHALRSLEFAGGAYTEGTAHFLSTLAFNNTSAVAWFRYYKEAVVNSSHVPFETIIAYTDLAQGNYRVNVENGGDAQWGGTTAWMRNKCPNEAALGGYSVEMDWLRFWWDVRTNYSLLSNGQTIPPLSTGQIFEFLRYTEEFHAWENEDAKDVWEQLNDAIDDDNAGLLNYVSTFRSLADWNGVNY